MTRAILLEVDCIHRGMSIAILSDGQEVPIANWIGAAGECAPEDAIACVCGPDFDGHWYSVKLSDFTGAVIQ